MTVRRPSLNSSENFYQRQVRHIYIEIFRQYYQRQLNPFCHCNGNILRYRQKNPWVLTYSYEVLANEKYPSVRPTTTDILFSLTEIGPGVASISCSDDDSYFHMIIYGQSNSLILSFFHANQGLKYHDHPTYVHESSMLVKMQRMCGYLVDFFRHILTKEECCIYTCWMIVIL